MADNKNVSGVFSGDEGLRKCPDFEKKTVEIDWEVILRGRIYDLKELPKDIRDKIVKCEHYGIQLYIFEEFNDIIQHILPSNIPTDATIYYYRAENLLEVKSGNYIILYEGRVR